MEFEALILAQFTEDISLPSPAQVVFLISRKSLKTLIIAKNSEKCVGKKF